MKRNFKGLKIVSIVFGLIQAAFVVFLGVAYGLDNEAILKVFTPLVIFIILGVFIFIDLILILATVVLANRSRFQTDLKVIDMMGSESTQILDFGQIAVVVVDDNNTIIWCSELFTERHINIIDQNIFEWMPQLRAFDDILNMEREPKVFINGRDYKVEHIKQTGVYLFKDVSEYETAYQFAKDQSLVIGVCNLDNFEEFSKKDEESSSLILLIREKMLNFSKEYGLLLKRLRQDLYLILANHKTFTKIESDGFKILGEIRKIGEQNQENITLSMGFSHGYPNIESLNEEATKALEIAMARGGDQIVVNRYGQDIDIVGAQNEAAEKRNKVKVRVLADSLISIMKAASNVIIVGHSDMDMDCLGGALGIYTIANSVGAIANIVYDPKSTEKKTRQAMRQSFSRETINNIMISPTEALARVKPQTLVILVDLYNPDLSLAPKVFAKAKKVAIIDHHRRSSKEVIDTIYQYIEPSASSASELVTELIFYSTYQPRIQIEPAIATIMLSGLVLDTHAFKTKTTGIRTFETSMVLKEFGADVIKANQFLEDDFDEFLLINSILSTLTTPFAGVVVCKATDGVVEKAVLSKVANRCLELKDVKAAFVLGQVNNKHLRISARSDSSINVQIIMEKLGGGGHLASAAAAFQNKTIDEVNASLLEAIEEKIHDAIIKD